MQIALPMCFSDKMQVSTSYLATNVFGNSGMILVGSSFLGGDRRYAMMQTAKLMAFRVLDQFFYSSRPFNNNNHSRFCVNYVHQVSEFRKEHEDNGCCSS